MPVAQTQRANQRSTQWTQRQVRSFNQRSNQGFKAPKNERKYAFSKLFGSSSSEIWQQSKKETDSLVNESRGLFKGGLSSFTEQEKLSAACSDPPQLTHEETEEEEIDQAPQSAAAGARLYDYEVEELLKMTDNYSDNLSEMSGETLTEVFKQTNPSAESKSSVLTEVRRISDSDDESSLAGSGQKGKLSSFFKQNEVVPCRQIGDFN